jgi:cell division GTPase FtsZ
VNPQTKSIEIAAIGLGQGGGNIAAELYRRGYPAIVLNTATTDLSSLVRGPSALPAEHCYYIGAEGYDGAGGDAGYGRECIRRYATAIKRRVEALAQNVDVLLICAGLGGGTGSAVAELISTLAELDLPTLVLATLPTEHESAIAKVNAVRALNETVAHKALGLILIDNAGLAKMHGGVSSDRYYSEINRLIIEPLDALNRLNDREGLVPIRSFDGEDFRRLMLSRGMVSFSTAKLPRLSAEALLDAVTEGLLRNELHPAGYRLENIAYLGVVIEASDIVLANAPFAMFEWLSEQIKAETQGAAVYFGIYRSNAQDSGTTTLRIVASSQSIPDGVHTVVEQAAREGGQLQGKLQRSVAGLELGDLGALNITRNAGTRRRGIAIHRPHRPIAAKPSSEPSKSVGPPPLTLTAAQAVTQGWPVDREAYEHLAREFKATDSDLVRRSLQERLEQDQKSSSPLIRYYAVSTMSRLDPTLFESALRLATRDNDATVRTVALKALQHA